MYSHPMECKCDDCKDDIAAVSDEPQEKNLHEEVFKPRLRESYKGTRFAAEWLRRLGYEVHQTPGRVAGTHAEWKEYADSGDLIILPAKMIVEVKVRTFRFTGAGDFLYPTMIVCAQHSWERKPVKPLAYLILSSDMKYAGCVYGGDARRWGVDAMKDRALRDKLYTNFTAKLSDVFFCPTDGSVDPLKEMIPPQK